MGSLQLIAYPVDSYRGDTTDYSVLFREKIGDMMLARIFRDQSVEIPEDFGRFVTVNNCEKEINSALK